MSPIEAARQLDGIDPFERDGQCYACRAWWRDGDSHDPLSHRPDCPILALPRIVAALEAAERVAVAWEQDKKRREGNAEPVSPYTRLVHLATILRPVSALTTILRGEEVNV